MYVIPRSDGPYTLFDRLGNIWVYSTKAQVVKALGGYQALSYLLERNRPASSQQWLASRFPDTLPAFLPYEQTRFLLLNTVGMPVVPDDFIEFARVRRVRVQGDCGVPYDGSKCRTGDGWRRMRTTAERRLNALVVFEDGEVVARPCRRGRNLPQSRDLVARSFSKNWKRYRKTQYRSR